MSAANEELKNIKNIDGDNLIDSSFDYFCPKCHKIIIKKTIIPIRKNLIWEKFIICKDCFYENKEFYIETIKRMEELRRSIELTPLYKKY